MDGTSSIDNGIESISAYDEAYCGRYGKGNCSICLRNCEYLGTDGCLTDVILPRVIISTYKAKDCLAVAHHISGSPGRPIWPPASHRLQQNRCEPIVAATSQPHMLGSGTNGPDTSKNRDSSVSRCPTASLWEAKYHFLLQEPAA